MSKKATLHRKSVAWWGGERRGEKRYEKQDSVGVSVPVSRVSGNGMRVSRVKGERPSRELEKRERACVDIVLVRVYIRVCLSSGINRSLFRSRSSWRIPPPARRHPYESIIRMWSRYRLSIRRTYSSKYSIDFSPPLLLPRYPRFTILLILSRSGQPPYSSYVCAFEHVFRLSANSSSLVIADSRLL